MPAVRLRSTRASDLDDLRDLWNDGRVMRWVGFPSGLGYDSEQMRNWYAHVSAAADRHHFVVVDDELGFCGEAYYQVDAQGRRAALDIKLRPEAQGQGRATAALEELIVRVFAREATVECVWTEPSRRNRTARRLYRRVGLRPRLRPRDLGAPSALGSEVLPESYWERRRES